MSDPRLRPYQQECLQAVKTNLDAGITRQLVVAATGTGKTAILSNLPASLGIRRMLVLAHRDELLEQAAEKLRHWNPRLKCAIEAGEQRSAASADVVVASVATLGRTDSKRLERFPRDWPEAVVVDEAHHAPAASYQTVFNRFGLLDPENHTLLLGVTATPFRADGEDLSRIFERVSFEYDIRQAIADGWLSDVRGLRLRTHARLDRVKQRAGDFATDELAAAVNTPERNAGIVKGWFEHAHGRLARFRARETGVLANCALLTEGFDAPLTSCVIMARPTRSQGLYLQCIGRGTLARAFEVAERWVNQNERQALAIVSREAKWHDQPATPRQIELLRKKFGPGLPEGLTKGRASDLIGSLLAQGAPRQNVRYASGS